MATVRSITRKMHDATQDDRDLVKRAYSYAQEAHKEQKRYSGEPYFLHLEETAKILAEWNMDAITIATGLLHDIIEDTDVTSENIKKEFGDEILFLIEGVTKLGKLKYHGLERHVESLRKLFVATSKDVRVIVVKLADKLHNMRTLKHVPAEKRKRLGLEAIEIYAPLANRLGMGKVKGELEDLVFPYVYPDEYKKVHPLFQDRVTKDKKHLESVYRTIRKELNKNHIKDYTVDYRVKHLYSLYKKLKRYDMDISKIYDIVALRVIVPTMEDCYRVLGLVHKTWRPLPGRIKDYIALPKPNGYQSLHTTIFTGESGIAEIQVRTQQMHEEAEYGVAAWFAYKENEKQTTKKTTRKKTSEQRAFEEKYGWVRELHNLHREQKESGELLSDMKMDLFEDRIFLFTPEGDVIDLPSGSGPIDFAYTIHTDIGNRTSAARINGKMSALSTKLKNGDIVEIITKKDAHPTGKWLDYVKTQTAKKHIRAHVKENSLVNKFLKWKNG